MQKPKDWNTAENIDFLKSTENIDFSSEELSKIIKASKSSTLLVAFYKYEIEKHFGFIPTIKINASINPTKSFTEFKIWNKKSSEGIKNYVENFEYIIEPKEIILSGKKGIFSSAKYSLKMRTGEIMNIKSLNYLIPIGKYYLTFSFLDGQENDDCSAEFNQLIKTIFIK